MTTTVNEPREGWIDAATGDGYAPDQPKSKHAEHDLCYWAGYEQGRLAAERAIGAEVLDVERLAIVMRDHRHGAVARCGAGCAEDIAAEYARLTRERNGQ